MTNPNEQPIDNGTQEGVEQTPKTVDDVIREQYEQIEKGVQEPEERQPENLTITLQNGQQLSLEGYDPEVQKELSEGYLRQSDYTKKTQELADIRRELARVDQDVNAYKTKAEQYDQLDQLVMSNPQLFQAIQAAASGQPIVAEDAFGEGIDGNAMANTIQQAVSSAVSPIRAELEAIKGQMSVRDSLQQLSSVEPRAAQMEGEIRSLMRENPALSPEEAFKIASFDHAKTEMSTAETIRRNNAANASSISGPSPNRGAQKPVNFLENVPRENALQVALEVGKRAALDPNFAASIMR